MSADSDEMKQKAKTVGKRYIGFHNHRLNYTNP